MAGTDLILRTGRMAIQCPDQYVVLPGGYIRPPIDDQDWLFWHTWDYLLHFRRVALDDLPEGRVSTVVLDMDHDPGIGWEWEQGEDGWPAPIFPVGYRPLIYETMVFGGKLGGQQRRYRSREEALAGHAEIVAVLIRTRARAKKK